jgi:hypothetical protein
MSPQRESTEYLTGASSIDEGANNILEQSSSSNAHGDMEGKDVEMASAKFASPCEVTTNMGTEMPVYKVYKRRFFGLFQLVLLNIVISWDVRRPRICIFGLQNELLKRST